ncbi:substrate-binding domain-containing protein [Pantoea ananatis]|uniref:substrate-binding domain-containing protein n=1 Tax=Pantoea ananas TaxID=553 RepID=UPI00061CAB92|nr:substrate-binding domain-containing protein [Pantoea ananatis]PQK97777.1 autoinducer 2 ABC transporter substrate-binding protein [Pantoea ananatis]CRH31827.1 YneA [Pantoea ananatis]
MNRRNIIKLLSISTLLSVSVSLAFPMSALASETKTMVTVVKEAGVPWFNILNQGLKEGGEKNNLKTSMVGPTRADPAQQVKLIEDLIAKKVDVIGLVPLDTKVTAQVVKRARDAGIMVITQEGPNQEGKTWDVELMSAKAYGEAQMKALAREMGEKGEYVVLVGTLTTTGHNQWADAAIAYQKEHYPNMKLAADRFPGADFIDESERVTQDILKAHPNVTGIMSMGSNGPIGAGNVLKKRHLEKKIALVGTTIPSQARAYIMSGVIREGFLWSPKEAGLAMTDVARLALDNAEFKTGMTIPGLGEATVDNQNKVIMVDRILQITKANVNDLVKLGL